MRRGGWWAVLLGAALMLSGPAAAKPTRHPTKPRHAQARTAVRPRPLPLIVVDAGHGGFDPGAVGPSGTQEKTVALAAAQELGRQLRATRRYRVVFTRERDRFVPLARRIRDAATNRAALMVSLHADASPDHAARGASVYVRPADSGGPSVAKLPAHGAPRAIARALSLSPPDGSVRLQSAVVDSLDDGLRMVPDPARQARLFVLGAAGIPSVLVEMGFISNRQDEALLRSPRHRAQIARAIRDAVDAYFAGQGRSRPRA